MITFNELGLGTELLRSVDQLGYTIPTSIQEKTIPAILNSDKDIIALAQTGTGKTAGFGLPIIQKIDAGKKTVQALILCPTRELCMQITRDLKAYSKYFENISIVPVYGGASIDTQVQKIRKGVQIVVGTPGRTLDLLNRKALNISQIKWLVLDEADEMLNMGFREDLDSILSTTPKEKQTLLFSATMPSGVKQISSNYMESPMEITSGIKNTGAENVEHHYYIVKASDRYLALKRLVDVHPNIYGLIFCRTRSEANEVATKLIQDGYNADALHGDLSQAQRDYVMGRFRNKQLQLLVATDVAARGIDIIELTHVLNYNLPDDSEVYIHRSGRTGRAGKQGISIIISHTRESGRIRELEKLVGKKFFLKNVPSGKEICEKRLYTLMDKIEKIEVDEAQIGPFLPAINKKLEWLDREELLKRFVSVEFNRFLEYYKNASDINVEKEDHHDRKTRSSGKKFTRFYINIGSKHQIKAPNLIGLINDETKSKNIAIGKIDILRNFSFFEIDRDYEKLVLESFKNSSFGSVSLSVQVSKPEGEKDWKQKEDWKSKEEWGNKKRRNKRKR